MITLMKLLSVVNYNIDIFFEEKIILIKISLLIYKIKIDLSAEIKK